MENQFVTLIRQGAMAIGACADEAAGSAVGVGGHEAVRRGPAQAHIVEGPSAEFTREVPSSHEHHHRTEANRVEKYTGSSTRLRIR